MPAIEVSGLRKAYGNLEAVREVDFSIEEGEVFGLLGPNGAGKTTTVEILEGYRTRDAGTVRVLGQDPGERPPGLRERVGIVLADTKFEFGIDEASGEIILIDEALTPDSSRFWDASTYEPGRAQASFDKQFVRDWLETQAWDKNAPGPALPEGVVTGTRARYVEAYERITGASFARYLEEDVIAP
jgi:phosphoribosylaminoimidazole-succinocarboxamide synthase